MGPRTERSAGQRTFLLLMLIAVILFGVHFESDCNGFKFSLQCRRFLWARNLPVKAPCWNFPKRGGNGTTILRFRPPKIRLHYRLLQICQLLLILGAWNRYIFAFWWHHKTSKGCYVYLATHRPSVIDRFPLKATLIWHSWAECETKTSWCLSIIWKLECFTVLRLSKAEDCDGEYR